MQLTPILRPVTWFGRWLLGADQIRAVRAAIPDRGESGQRAYRQAELLVEVGRRVAEPAERLPPGSPAAVEVGLYRDAVYWALVSERRNGDAPASDLAALLGQFPRERLVEIAGDGAALESVERTFTAPRLNGAQLEVTSEEAGQARAFAEKLLLDLDQPRRKLQKLQALRWAKIGALLAAILLVIYGFYALVRGPNLLADKPFRTSSTWAGCATDPECTSLLFHTDPENNPWVEFDMGKPTKFHQIEVHNRTDCCMERAVPLIVEMSNDHERWVEIGRRDTEFSSWTIKFPPKTARYLKLRVPKAVAFHLKSVAVR
jgi:hypothetical protein